MARDLWVVFLVAVLIGFGLFGVASVESAFALDLTASRPAP